MNCGKTIAALIIAAALQNPCAVNAADEDRELSLIAAEQEKTGKEQLDELNPALTETISTERKEDTDKEIKDRRKKLRETRREKERENERKLRDSTRQKDAQMETESPIVIDPSVPEPEPIKEPEPTPEPVAEPEPIKEPVKAPESVKKTEPVKEPVSAKVPEKKTVIEPSQFTEPLTEENKVPKPLTTPPSTETIQAPNPKEVYANFAEVARALGFIPLYMPRKSGYEITAIYAEPGIVEMQYGRRWEPEVGIAVRTYKRAEGEELRDISGVSGVKWRVDTTTGTTIYLAKISDNEQVAAWAVGHYTFSAHSKNISFAGFHALVADELVELSTHYYLDL